MQSQDAVSQQAACSTSTCPPSWIHASLLNFGLRPTTEIANNKMRKPPVPHKIELGWKLLESCATCDEPMHF